MVFAMLVTRKMMIFVFVQLAILEYLLNGWRKIVIGLFASTCSVYVFGLMGDIRSGRDLILSLANLRGSYPDWLPSGLIWIYIYILTPMANYINYVRTTMPSFNPLDLFTWLVPSGIMAKITGVTITDTFANDWQVSGAFNIASGLVGPYQAYGHAGVVVFGTLIAFITFFQRHKSTLCSLLNLVVIYASLALMVFNNNFMSLNVAFQFVIIRLLFGEKPPLRTVNLRNPAK
jgi:hypothetical protein